MKGCRPLEQSEIDLLLSNMTTPRDKALFMLGIKTGFRISELLSIKVSDVFKFGRVSDCVYVARSKMKRKVEGRSIALHDDAKKLIMELITTDALKPEHYLFRSAKGSNRPLSRFQAWRVLKCAVNASSLSGMVATHSMRKTFAANVYSRLDKDLVKTQRALGHKSIAATVSYLSFSQEEIDAAILA